MLNSRAPAFERHLRRRQLYWELQAADEAFAREGWGENSLDMAKAYVAGRHDQLPDFVSDLDDLYWQMRHEEEKRRIDTAIRREHPNA